MKLPLIINYIDNVISHRQAAYLKGDSTTHQLLYLVHYIRLAWQNGKVVQAIFLDVEGVFDKFWHLGLFAKLDQVSVTGKCFDLFKSYLTNRRQVTVVDRVKSEVRHVMAGIPQGSKQNNVPLKIMPYKPNVLKTRPRQSVPNSGFHLVGPGLILVNHV